MFEVLLHPKAIQELRRLPPDARARVRERLMELAVDPLRSRPGLDVKALKSTRMPRLYRLRVGDYRAIFRVDAASGKVLVEVIYKRSQAYRGTG